MFITHTSHFKKLPQKIISLVPSQTELLADLGLGQAVTGITKFCIHPQEWFNTKTRIGGTKTVNIPLIKDLQPDLIIANKEENVKEQVEELANEFDVWLTDVNNLEDALQMIQDIGILTGSLDKAIKIIDEIVIQFSRLDPSSFYNTCYLIWKDPFMTVSGDTFINDMMYRCGFKNIFAGDEKRNNKISRYPQISIDQLLIALVRQNHPGRHCQLLLLSSEPFPFRQKHIDELQQQLPGIKIILVDGEMFSWYGSRLLKAPGYFNKLLKTLGQ